jgi:hypothetical protein
LEDDLTQRSSWDTEPSYASHYSSDADRPNLCKVAHNRPAAFGRTPFNFSTGAKDYVPFVGTSVVRDSQLLLLRLYHRWVIRREGSDDQQCHDIGLLMRWRKENRGAAAIPHGMLQLPLE